MAECSINEPNPTETIKQRILHTNDSQIIHGTTSTLSDSEAEEKLNQVRLGRSYQDILYDGQL